MAFALTLLMRKLTLQVVKSFAKGHPTVLAGYHLLNSYFLMPGAGLSYLQALFSHEMT